jgi:hypothetical protein
MFAGYYRMNRRRLVLGTLSLCVHIVLNGAPSFTSAQSPRPLQSYPTHLPYRFENFVWWSDNDLRTLVKAHVPGLTDEVDTTSVALGRVRNALTALLREKGIVAEVQSQEPSYSAVAPQPTDLFGQPLPRPSTPTISFSVLTPQVVIGEIQVQSGNDDVDRLVRSEVDGNTGRPYNSGSQAFWLTQIDEVLARNGYLASEAHFEHGPPKETGERFVVDLTLTINPGLQYHISSISADGGPLLQRRDSE